MVAARQYSHSKQIGAEALRGLAVGIRGVLEAKRMAREAKSGREKRIADHYVRLKRQDLQERRLAISEGAAEQEMEQVRLDSRQAEQEHKDESHKLLAEAYDRLESLHRERNRATAPKEMERIDNEIAIEARAVVRLGKNLGYSYPHLEQSLKEREDAAVAFEEKSGRIDALNIPDERKAALHTALGNEFFGLRTGEGAKVDEILGQLEAIEKLDETPEQKQELKDSYLNKEFGVDTSAAAEAAKKAESLQTLEENKDAFSQQEYARIRAQIQLGESTDIKGLIKPTPQTGFAATEEIVDIYRDIPNRTVLNSIGSAITSKDGAQRFLLSAHRWLDGRPFEEVDKTSKERVAKLFINEVMENVAGGDIVKGHLRAYKILKDQLPALLSEVAQLEASGKSLGHLTEAPAGSWRWDRESSDAEVTALRTKLTDALNGYIALRSEVGTDDAERALYASLFAEIGSGYEANKATIEGLIENVSRDLSAMYKAVMGPEWGEYATTVDFQQDTDPPDVWISEVLKDYELAGKNEVVVQGGAEPSQVVDILAEDAEAIMEAKHLTPEGYEKSVEAQLRKLYPDLSDDEINGLMDDFREKADLSTPETEDATVDRPPKQMPTLTPPSNEAATLDDVIDEASEKRNWTTIFTSMNPLRGKFWKSLDKNAWDTLEALYEMARFYREPTADEKSEAFNSAIKAGKTIEEARKAVPSIKWQMPAVLPTAMQIAKELLFNDPDNTPILDEILDYALKTTGIGAAFGDEKAKQEFYQLVDEDPFAFWGWILPVIGQMKKVKLAGTVGKMARGVGKTADIVDMSLIEGASDLSKILIERRNLRFPNSGAMEGTDSTVMKQRRSKAAEAIQQKYNEILTKADQRAWSIESFDISKVRDALFDAHEGGQYARHGGFRRKYNRLGQVLIQPLKSGDDFGLLAKTSALLDELRTARISKPMRDLEVEIIDDTLARTFDDIANEAKDKRLTIHDIDTLRFRFRKKVKDALQKEGLYETGSNDLVQKIYATLTQDFYDLIENEVKLAPDNFPKNFIDEVRQAKADYQRIATLRDSAAAKLIRKHYEAPHKLVTHILNGRSTRKSIEDMKTLLGDEMWGQLQAGFLQRLFEGTGRKKEFTWDGLKRQIQKINATDENRLRLIFGDEKAKELAELAEWSAKFASEAAPTKSTSVEFIDKLIAEGKLPDLLHRLVDIVDFGGAGVEPKAVSVADAAVRFVGDKLWTEYVESDDGLKRLRESHSWRVATKDDKVITITLHDFVEAIERQKSREQMPKDTIKKKKHQ